MRIFTKLHSLLPKKDAILFIVPIILIIIIYLWHFDDLIIGSELSNVPINLNILLKNSHYVWNDGLFGGFFSPLYLVDVFPHNVFYLVLHFLGIKINVSIRFYFIFLHLLTYLSAFFLAMKVFKRNILASSLTAFLYSFNYYYFSQLDHQFQLLNSAFAPILLLFVIRMFEKPRFREAVLLNIIFLFIFLSSVHSIPSLIITVFPAAGLLIYLIAKEKDQKLSKICLLLKNLVQAAILFISLNLWWVVSLIVWNKNVTADTQGYNSDIGWLVFSSPNKFYNVFRNLGYWPWQDLEYNFNFHVTINDNPIFIITSFILVSVCLISFFTNIENKYVTYFKSLFLVSFFFIMAPNFPLLGNIFVWFYENIPYFNTFLNTYYKFSWIYSLSLAFLVGFSVYFIKRDSLRKIVYSLILLSNLLLMSPYITGIWIRAKSTLGSISVKSIPDSYFQIGDRLKEERLDKKLLSLPESKYNYYYDWGSYFSDVTGRIIETPQLKIAPSAYMFRKDYQELMNQFYRRPEIYLINNKSTAGIVSLLNVRYLFIDNTVRDIQLYANSAEILEMLKGNKSVTEDVYIPYFSDFYPRLDGWYLYNVEQYLPHLYTPQTIITTTKDIDFLPEIVSRENYNIRSAIYLNQQEYAIETVNSTPIIEYRKIDPTKYRVIIHQASSEFPLVFSESFHDGWNTYLVDYKRYPINFNESDYRILDGNEEDQANVEELKGFIEKGYISSLGDVKEKNIKHTKWENNNEVFDYNEKYKIDFISKNFQDTIQNDNLERGKFYETWLEKPIDNNENHSVVNGYANSWTINPNEICVDNPKCVKNADGTYDLELIVEFWPQRLFYIGAFVSGITFFGCLVYLVRMHTTNKCRKDV